LQGLTCNIFGFPEEAVVQGIYSKKGGYLLFIEKSEELKKMYLQEPRKGIQVTIICLLFLGSYRHTCRIQGGCGYTHRPDSHSKGKED
jgi:hypothetical protein